MNLMLKYYAISCLRKILPMLRIFPMKDRRVLFYSFSGKEYSDSPKYIAEYMEENAPGKYEIIWAFTEKDKWEKLKERGWKTVGYKSLLFIYYYITAKFIVNNGGPFKIIPRRKGQEIINTWHGGGAYKKTGTDNPYKNKYQILYNRDFGQKDVTLFLTSSDAFTKHCIRGAFQYYGQILECGLPRNDVLLQTGQKPWKEEICGRYGIEPSKKIILYAPTWRNYGISRYEKINANQVIKACGRRFGGEWIFLYRGHNLSERMESGLGNRMIDVTDYEDMQKLLSVSDVLISDYSSCIWDFSFLQRPCFLFMPDAGEYEEKFGFYTPPEKWGFPVAESNKALTDIIESFQWEKGRQEIQRNHAHFGSHETGKARKMVLEYIDAAADGKTGV